VLEDRERIRTLATFPDGSSSQQRVKGPLVVRYINDASRAWVVRDLTGDAFIDTHSDGSSRFTLKNGTSWSASGRVTRAVRHSWSSAVMGSRSTSPPTGGGR
jgi:hypothetical protein